jgi:DNA polymerase V
MSQPVFALIDCNNFFVSCERLFRPDLEGKPVVVLSSNDGCVVSRSNEAKAIGVPMGAPVFKHRDLFRQHQVRQFSANFELYGDVSERITRMLTGITPRTEVYSVDESFLDLSLLDITNYAAWSAAVRARILREVGIPVSIGIAPTKTLAKLASEHAKTEPALNGVLDLYSTPADTRERYLIKTPIKDIWGIGWRLAPKLKAEGVFTAADVAHMRPRHISQLMGVHGRQLVAELGGQSCHPLQAFGKVRQTVMNGRMFGEDTADFAVLEAAIASLTARAAYSLRRENLLAGSAIVSLSTNRFKPGYQRQDQAVSFAMPTADTGHITAQLVQAMQQSFNPHEQYHRANILLFNLVSADSFQTDLFGAHDLARGTVAGRRLRAFDSINTRYGRSTVRFAAEDLSKKWVPKHQLRSPRYTTHWQELPIARILEG